MDFKCARCINCFRSEDCGKCHSCKDSQEFGGPNPRSEKCFQRICVHAKKSIGGSGDFLPPTVVQTAFPPLKTRRRGRPRKNFPTSGSSPAFLSCETKKSAGRKGAPNSSSSVLWRGTRQTAKKVQKFLQDAGVEEADVEEELKDRQCLGPACVNYAIEGSKYCCQQCGVNLAKNRILEILPGRLSDWKLSPSVAESHQQVQIEKINEKRAAIKQRLDQLDKDEADLKEWKEAAKRVEADSDEEGSDGESEQECSEQTMYCVTCAQEIPVKTALKHITRCAGKFESQTSYGTSFPTPNDKFDLFCDVYNKASQTYCKRLRIICPEHSKDEKIEESEICAAPLVVGQPLVNFKVDPKSVCLVAKKRCAKHYRWERTRRALVAQERLNLLLKLEEMYEEEGRIKVARDNRGSLVALLLNHTTTSQQRRSNADPLIDVV